MRMKCDAVFQGGGVKGIGFAGAVAEFESSGYEFENVAGASAGAIAAALIAAGYSGEEIKKELNAVSFESFRKKAGLSRFTSLGQAANLLFRYGIYRADNFENWISKLLERKGVCVFGDVKTCNKDGKYLYKFQAVAADISCNRMMVLPRDLEHFGIDADSFEIAKAVRMSMSIPFYYEPYAMTDVNGITHFIADGGLLSNYPVWLLDDGAANPQYPTFGFKFTEEGKLAKDAHAEINNFALFTKEILETVFNACDNYLVSEAKGDAERSIMIPINVLTENGIRSIRTTDFDITREESNALFQNGRYAARKFISSWDFEKWKDEFRHNNPDSSARCGNE